jgi:hypothetical protein
MSLTDVAKVRQRIDLEQEAAIRALNAPAVVSNHAAITARSQERLDRLVLHLQVLDRAGLHTELKTVLQSDHLWTDEVQPQSEQE